MNIEKIKLNQINNYFDNPRHEVGISEDDTLKKLFDSVGYQNMTNLAEDIYINGIVESSLITVVKNNSSYIVYEGNRRIACIKWLVNPDRFSFLPKTQIDYIKKIKNNNVSKVDLDYVECLVVSEDDALFNMGRLHSGEDKGRGLKAWNPREQELFEARTNPDSKSTIANIISSEYEKYFGEDIRDVIAYTNLQRLFNNKEIRKSIGIEVNDESTFTKKRMVLISEVINQVNDMVKQKGIGISRIFNRSRVTEDILLPIINELNNKTDNSYFNQDDTSLQDKEVADANNVKILKKSSITIFQGNELFLDDVKIVNELEGIEIIANNLSKDGNKILGSNQPGKYFINYRYATQQEQLTLTIKKRRKISKRENGFFDYSVAYKGDIDLSDISPLVHQMRGLNYDDRYLLIISSFRTILEDLVKEYISKNKLELKGSLYENFFILTNSLKSVVSFDKNNNGDAYAAEKREIHKKFNGYKGLTNFLDTLQTKFKEEKYDKVLHSLTHNPSMVKESFALEIANETILPLYMLIKCLRDKNIIE